MTDTIIDGKSLIAICDILGFGDWILSENIDNKIIFEEYSFLRKTTHHSLLFSDFPKEPPTLSEIDKHPGVGIVFFSDTILLYARNDTDDCCKEVLRVTAQLLFENMFNKPTRLRCGISYNDVFIDIQNNIFYGKGIVEAAHLEKAQQWSGGALSPAAEKRLEPYINSIYFMDWPIVKYEVPMKPKYGLKSNVAINWTNGIHVKMNWGNNIDLGKNDILEKRDRTKEFHEYYCQQCFPINRNRFNLFNRLFRQN